MKTHKPINIFLISSHKFHLKKDHPIRIGDCSKVINTGISDETKLIKTTQITLSKMFYFSISVYWMYTVQQDSGVYDKLSKFVHQ